MNHSIVMAGAAIVALCFFVSGCMQEEASNPQQAQYLATLRVCPPGSHAQSSPIGISGYRCILN